MSKEQERAELHRTIWQIATDLRGSVDGWDFKNYVLGFLFYRFISEDLTAHLNHCEAEAGNEGFNYATDVSDDDIDDDSRRQTIDEKGFFIYPSELFQNVVANADNDPNLNVTLGNIFEHIESSAIGTESEPDMKGLFSDIDVNSPKLGATIGKRNELLTKIMKQIGNMDLGGDLHEAQIDAFGDAYEYLMTMYASNAGKSGGEFFTPQEVAELLAHIACAGKNRISKVYDPACGSGSLLLKFAKVLGSEKAANVSFHGQEINITTYNLCRINMFLHHVPFNKFDIQLGDTLTEPKHLADLPYDAIVSNPPYSTHWAGDGNPLLINDDRYSPAGVLAPKTKADLAFTMHILYHLSTTGTAAIVEFPGVLYRGGAEQKIRQYLIENNFVDTVIQLPANLFFGVGIATCIIVLKKSKADNSVLFIDASEECVKNGNKNKLTDDNIGNVLGFFKNRVDVDYKAKLVSNKDIIVNDCNLSVSSYVEQEDKREKIDIEDVNAKLAILLQNHIDLSNEINCWVASYESQSHEFRIDKLIKELCPEGVEKVRLGDMCTFNRGKTITAKDAIDGEIPVIAGGQMPSYYHNEYNRTGETVTVAGSGAYAGFVGYWNKPIWVSDAFTVDPCEKLLVKYVYAFLKRNQQRIYETQKGAGVPHVHGKDIANFEIPLPPLAIQQEIVNILDKFTSLVESIDEEMKLRQKQYEYYREKLLGFS